MRWRQGTKSVRFTHFCLLFQLLAVQEEAVLDFDMTLNGIDDPDVEVNALKKAKLQFTEDPECQDVLTKVSSILKLKRTIIEVISPLHATLSLYDCYRCP